MYFALRNSWAATFNWMFYDCKECNYVKDSFGAFKNVNGIVYTKAIVRLYYYWL